MWWRLHAVRDCDKRVVAFRMGVGKNLEQVCNLCLLLAVPTHGVYKHTLIQ